MTPESDQHLISPYSIIIKSHFLGHKNKENDQQLRSSWLFTKCFLSAPRKCIENSMENMLTDIKVPRVTSYKVVQIC